MALSSSRLLLDKEAILNSYSGCTEAPSSSLQECIANGAGSLHARKASEAARINKNNLSEEDKSLRSLCRSRRYRRRADLPPDVLAKVREKDKERKRITRLKMRGGISDYCFPINRKWPSGLNLLPVADRSTTAGNSNLDSIPNTVNEWNAEEEVRTELSLTVQEYLIGQTLTAEENVKSGFATKLDPLSSHTRSSLVSDGDKLNKGRETAPLTSNSLQTGGIEENEEGDLKSNEMMIRMNADMLAHTEPIDTLAAQYVNVFAPGSQDGSFCLPEIALITKSPSLLKDGVSMLEEATVPLVLTKIPGYEIINVAVNCDEGKRNEAQEDEVESCTDSMKSGDMSNDVCTSIDCKADEGRFKTDGDIDVGKCHQTLMGNKYEAAKEIRRRQRSRSVLPPEKLAYIRAIDAERKRIARTRMRLLEMTADDRNGNTKRRRLMKRRKHPLSIEDATKFGWPNVNDERKERAVLEKRFEKYKAIIEKMIEAEKQACGGLMPLEVLRAMVIEQAKLFTFLTQRNDLRRSQVGMVEADGTDDRMLSSFDSIAGGTLVSVDASTDKDSRIAQSEKGLVVDQLSIGSVMEEQSVTVGCRRRSSAEGYTVSPSKNQSNEISRMEVKPDVAGLIVVPQVANKVSLKVRRTRRKPVRRSALSDEELAMRRALEAARKRIWRAKRRAEIAASENVGR